MTATVSLAFPIVADSNGTISSHDACIHVWQYVWQRTGSADMSADIMVAFTLGEWNDTLLNHKRIDLGELNAWIDNVLSL
jgi:hypothetical protein